MAMTAENSNSSSPHYSNATNMYECLDLPYIKNVSTTLAAIATLMGLPLNAWLMWLFAKGLWVGIVAFDILVLNTTLIQALYCLANPLIAVNMYYPMYSLRLIMLIAIGLMTVGWSLFQSCTSMKRYLAVVHPIVFLKFQAQKYLKYQVMCWGAIWVLTLGFCLILVRWDPEFPEEVFIIPFGIVLLINSFCSLSIMVALRRPAPGDVERERMHKLNHQAFRRVLITHLLVTLNVLPFICTWILSSQGFPDNMVCLSYCISYAFIGFTNIVQPWQSLSRMGKLPCPLCPGMSQEQTG